MGGYGSGRRLPNPKTAVEDALTLRVGTLAESFRLSEERGVPASGVCSWTRGGETTARLGTRVWWEGSCPRVRLTYTVTARGREPVDVALELDTDSTPAWFGGVRRWLLCPGASASRPCGRRVGTVHLPGGATRFACRDCHRLTYRSRQESRKWDSLYRRLAEGTGLSPADVRRALADWRVDGAPPPARADEG